MNLRSLCLSWVTMTTPLTLLLINFNHASSFQIGPLLKGSSSPSRYNTIVQSPTATRTGTKNTALYSTKPPKKGTKKKNSSPRRAPSRVTDPTGPTPTLEDVEEDVVALKDIPELQYDPNVHPIPHQPWRRGETAGCEDPIDAEWRVEAEEVMTKAVTMVGAILLDVTWYLTSVLVTIDDSYNYTMPMDMLKDRGPVINVYEPEDPQYKDPEDPNPEEIWSDEYDAELTYEKDEKAEADAKEQMYARKEDDEPDVGLDPDEVSLYMSEESRPDDMFRYTEEMEEKFMEAEKPVGKRTRLIDTQKLSTIAGAILDALEPFEDRLRVLDRHELILASPAKDHPDVLETQRQFDNARGLDVAVETQDPWDSNRILMGKLVDRNSMDVYINQQGRLVTIPLNFVRCVRLRGWRPPPEPEVDDEAPETFGDDEDDDDEAPETLGNDDDFEFRATTLMKIKKFGKKFRDNENDEDFDQELLTP